MESKKSTSSNKKILIVEDQFIEAHDLQLILEKAGYQVTGIARSVDQAVALIETEKPDLVFVDICLKGNATGIDLAKKLNENHIAFIYLSANSSRSVLEEAKKTSPYGFIVKPFREQDVLITLEIACYRQNFGIESQLFQEKILQESIDAIGASNLNWEEALVQLGKVLQTYMPFDYMQTGFVDNEYNPTGLLRRSFDTYEIINIEKFSKITGVKQQELHDLKSTSPKHEYPKIYQGDSFKSIFNNSAIKRLVIKTFGIKSFVVIPVRIENGGVFNFFFYSRNEEAYSNEHLNLLTKLEIILANFVTKMNRSAKSTIPIREIPATKQPVLEENNFGGFCSMIGTSKKMITVFDYIKKVAPSETSVLILGESGTGKEKVAQSIHNLSNRKNKPLVIINCGAIPDNLAESLLFGHEKGAFTGATEKRIGKFEIANGGTLFLDEIGEMPVDLQVKLLRVLQEKEIERIGSSSPIKVDVRIIAATNRNLEEEVAAGRFRLDLYYRLHVFPIVVPSLRERKEDIPALATHFIDSFCKISEMNPPAIAPHVIDQMLTYNWPGNIRELEHVIQRSLLLTEGDVIREFMIYTTSLNKDEEKSQEFVIQTIHDNERDYITYILKKCKGKVSGVGGAAEILNIPASTLNSKMKKLGIKNQRYS
ncbi:sigma 54-interacting response regulator [Flavobacterium sp.]|uniref:sigma 54-interacting response regulator n=1 Tax=Flavobacterium sp. TaxID=239 RepID=UPI002B4B89C3|nr:sigma 54-interacting response regulator [Flavobacterium sp.]HLP64685.1 sigma 54-interacting response regulator [Flavobacterium sp.]